MSSDWCLYHWLLRPTACPNVTLCVTGDLPVGGRCQARPRPQSPARSSGQSVCRGPATGRCRRPLVGTQHAAAAAADGAAGRRHGLHDVRRHGRWRRQRGQRGQLLRLRKLRLFVLHWDLYKPLFLRRRLPLRRRILRLSRGSSDVTVSVSLLKETIKCNILFVCYTVNPPIKSAFSSQPIVLAKLMSNPRIIRHYNPKNSSSLTQITHETTFYHTHVHYKTSIQHFKPNRFFF